MWTAELFAKPSTLNDVKIILCIMNSSRDSSGTLVLLIHHWRTTISYIKEIRSGIIDAGTNSNILKMR